MNARGRRPAERLLAPPGPLLDLYSSTMRIKLKFTDKLYPHGRTIRMDFIHIVNTNFIQHKEQTDRKKHCRATYVPHL